MVTFTTLGYGDVTSDGSFWSMFSACFIATIGMVMMIVLGIILNSAVDTVKSEPINGN